MNFDSPPDEAQLERMLVQWIQQARESSPARRTKAFEALYELARDFGPRAAAAIEVLVEGLEDPAPRIGESTVWALKYCSPDSIEPLVDCLRHPAALVRERAAHALGNVRDDARAAAAPALRRLLTDVDQAVRSRAAWALGLLHDADPATASGLVAMLARGTSQDQESALHAIGNLGQAPDSTLDWSLHEELITAALWNPGSRTRRWALYAMQTLGLAAGPEAELLLRLLEREQDVDVLVAILDRLKSLAAVVDLAPHGRLVAGLMDRGRRVAAGACEVLGAVGHGAPEAVPALTRALDEDGLQGAAAKALWAIQGTDAAGPILKALARMFDHDAESACDIVCLLGPTAAPLLPRVLAALAEEDWDLQWAAADALGAIASDAPETLAALLQALGHDSPIVRSSAARGLARIGEPAVPGLQALAGGVADPHSVGAVHALGLIGAPAAAALPELRAGMRLGLQPLSGWCAIAVAAVAADDAAIPFLVETLNSGEPAAPRDAAARALGAMGPAATGAVPALEAACLDEDDDVRLAAEEALVQVRRLKH